MDTDPLGNFLDKIHTQKLKLTDLTPESTKYHLNSVYDDGETLLTSAISEGQVDIVKKLIELGAKPNKVNKKQNLSPLKAAIYVYDYSRNIGYGQKNKIRIMRRKMSQILFDAEADPNAEKYL